MDPQSHMDYFKGEYSSSLNSEDLYDPDLPMVSARAKGGTLKSVDHSSAHILVSTILTLLLFFT